MNIIKKLSRVADKADVYYCESWSKNLTVGGWKSKSAQTAFSREWGIRAFKNGRVATGTTTDADNVEGLVDEVIEATSLGEELDIDFPKLYDFAPINIYDETLEKKEFSGLVNITDSLMSKISAIRTDSDCSIHIGIGGDKVKICNTEGFIGEYDKTSFALSCEITRVKENDIFMTWDYRAMTHLPTDIEHILLEISDEILFTYKYADRIVPSPTGRVPILFHPKALSALLLPLGMGVVGNNIYTKVSPLVNKLGEQIFDQNLTIIDDGTIEMGSHSAPFDDEGISKRRFPIVENGVLKNFVFDLTTAKKSGFQSNGCAHRVGGATRPGNSNVIVANGEVSFNKILSDIKDGIFIFDLLGVGQGNVLSGAFSNPVGTAFKIENGEIVGRIKNSAIAGNIYDNLKEITALSKETKKFGNLTSPYIRIDNINVTG